MQAACSHTRPLSRHPLSSQGPRPRLRRRVGSFGSRGTFPAGRAVAFKRSQPLTGSWPVSRLLHEAVTGLPLCPRWRELAGDSVRPSAPRLLILQGMFSGCSRRERLRLKKPGKTFLSTKEPSGRMGRFSPILRVQKCLSCDFHSGQSGRNGKWYRVSGRKKTRPSSWQLYSWGVFADD